MEVSFGLHLNPSIVKNKTLRAAQLREYPMNYTEFERGSQRVDFPYQFNEVTIDGSLGDVRKGNEKLGSEIITLILDRMETFIKDFIIYNNKK